MHHRHHIKPKHSGGSDDPSNLTPPISLVKHAMFHWCEWSRTGNEFDKVAWLSLTGQIGVEEIIESVIKENGRRRALQTKNNKELFFSSQWQSLQGRKGARKSLELHQEEIFERLKKNVESQLKTGTHPFQSGNRNWNESESAKKAAQTQLSRGSHPFQNPQWDRVEASRKAAQTQLLRGNHPSQTQDRGPNYAIVHNNKELIEQWWDSNRHRKAANGRQIGAKVCNRELSLNLTSLQPLVTFLNSLK